jgi:hypothetical protein
MNQTHPLNTMPAFQNHTRLSQLSEVTIQGLVISKYDLIATIYVHRRHYFNVYRRYNNSFEIILEDYTGDFHFHQNQTLFKSLQSVLCLSDAQMSTAHIAHLISIYDISPLFPQDALFFRWTDIQEYFSSAVIHFGYSDSIPLTQEIADNTNESDDEFDNESDAGADDESDTGADDEFDAGADEVDSVC